MELLRKVVVFLIFVCIISNSKSQKNTCRGNKVIPTDTSLLVLYSTNANDAKKKCSSAGGSLWVPSSDAEAVKITTKLRSRRLSKNETLLKIEFPVDTTIEKENGRQFTFYMYKKSADGFDIPLEFCVGDQTQKIATSCAAGLRSLLFRVYSGSMKTKATIPLNYFSFYDYMSKKYLSLFQVEKTPPNINGAVLIDSFRLYIPDISVFIGLTSYKGDEAWVSHNGIRFKDSRFPKSDPEICEQLSIPLTYDNGGPDFRKKRCDSDEGFSICQLDFVVSSEQVNCNTNSLRLHWTSIVPKKVKGFQVVVQATVAENKLSQSAALDDRGLTLSLDHAMPYTITVVAKASGCMEFTITRVLRVMLASSIPVPSAVMHAVSFDTRNDDENRCVVEWAHNGFESFVSSYELKFGARNLVKVNNPTGAFTFTPDSGTVRVEYDLREYDVIDYDNVKFQIEAVSCSGRSSSRKVLGSCTKPRTTDFIDKYTAIGVSSVVGFAALIWMVVGITWWKGRQVSQTKSEEEIGKESSNKRASKKEPALNNFASGATNMFVGVPSAIPHGIPLGHIDYLDDLKLSSLSSSEKSQLKLKGKTSATMPFVPLQWKPSEALSFYTPTWQPIEAEPSGPPWQQNEVQHYVQQPWEQSEAQLIYGAPGWYPDPMADQIVYYDTPIDPFMYQMGPQYIYDNPMMDPAFMQQSMLNGGEDIPYPSIYPAFSGAMQYVENAMPFAQPKPKKTSNKKKIKNVAPVKKKPQPKKDNKSQPARNIYSHSAEDKVAVEEKKTPKPNKVFKSRSGWDLYNSHSDEHKAN